MSDPSSSAGQKVVTGVSSDLDLDRLADQFITRIAKDGTSANASWRSTLHGIPVLLHRAFMRLVYFKLKSQVTKSPKSGFSLNSPQAICYLNSTEEGRVLMRSWAHGLNDPPSMPSTTFPSWKAAYDHYSSIVYQYGSPEAVKALCSGDVVVLGLRKASSTLANKGRGSYDDKIVVLNGKVKKKEKASVFPACTEPGAQYSHRASPGKVKKNPLYSDVSFNKVQGVDVNKDNIKDAGRLLAGTYEYREYPKGYLGDRAFQSVKAQVAERDTDGDGFFTDNDVNRIDKAGAGQSMLIHRGGSDQAKEVNTWSAGCQTIPKNNYQEFLNEVGKPGHFFYVLVNARESCSVPNQL